jgi:two-component system NtrC family sensor kinase
VLKTKLIPFLFALSPVFAIAQQSNPDDLKRQLTVAQHDSIRYKIFGKLSDFYTEKKVDSALFYIEECLSIARRNNKKLNVAASLNGKGLFLRHKGLYSESLQCYLEAFEIANDPSSEKSFWPLPMWIFTSDNTPKNSRLVLIGNLHMQMANLFIRTGNNDLCVYHFARAEQIGRATQSHYFLYYLYATMGIAYKNMNKPDSAMLIVQKGLALSKQFGFKENVSRLLTYMGEIYSARSQIDTARNYYHHALSLALEEKNFVSLVMIYFGLTKNYIARQEKDSSLYYGRKTVETLNTVGSIAGTIWNSANAYENLFRIYTMRNEPDSANKYLELTLRAKDSLNSYSVKSSAQAQDLFLREQIRLKELEKEKIRFRDRIRTYSMAAGIGVLFLLAVIFYRNNRQKQKAKARIEKAYEELKATQAQLIQREKMASLGELTAGIAHEIQNPLNFVNNFSDVSNELMEEMKNEMSKGNHEDVKAIVDDVKQNLEKISHHGKRADAIVKGMLQHSRLSPGKKDLTDINALCDECLKLAYHGLRAKDKSFDVTIQTHFDNSLSAGEAGTGKINIVPQDIGRVLLNLINNAFYAVNEKQKHASAGSAGQPYKPTVTISTKKLIDKPDSYRVEIRVADNGNGISEKIMDKIFQPFFTTKPTGQGTGLGLSLAYDIVKAHRGEIKVETKEDQGSEFMIQLPYSA